MGVTTPLRGVRIALAMTLGVAGLVATNGNPAAASPSSEYATSVQIGYTDAANPGTPYRWPVGAHVPIGSKVDDTGVMHTTRVYATFDLTPYKGKHFISSTLRFKEAAAADCSKRAIEIWRTKPVDATPTWDSAPAEIAKVDEELTPEYCPTAIFTSDMTSTIAQLLAEGKPKVTFEIRVPAAFEADPSYWRTLNWYNSVSLGITYNTAPKVNDQHMYNGGIACRTTAPYPTLGWAAGTLEGVVTDADANDGRSLLTEYAVWPENDPSTRRTYKNTYGISGRVAGVAVPSADLVNGQAYAWQYRVSDGTDTSDWSKTCHFVVDRTAPSAPTVTSANYPTGDIGQTPLGQPGQFTFDGHGDTDVAGFVYAWEYVGGTGGCSASGEFGQWECGKPFSKPGSVRADALGGTATVQLSPPQVGQNTLMVRSLDMAGNASEAVSYYIHAPSSEPIVTVVGAEPAWNRPVTLKFSPHPGMENVTSYTYKIGIDAAQTITPDADGTATVTFVASSLDGPQVFVRSTSANGFVSPETSWFYPFYPWPDVQSDVYTSADWQPHGGAGVPGTFTFSPPPGPGIVVGYKYSFNWGEFLDVPADADGRATVTWAPDASGIATLEVYAVMADGTWSEYSNIYQFLVN
jgi:hypothetical protein